MSYISDSGRPSPRAIAITGAAHLVIGWMALNLAGYAPGPLPTVQPIDTAFFPEEVRPADPAEPPPQVERPVSTDVPPPPITLEQDTPPIEPAQVDTSGDYQFDPLGDTWTFANRGISGDSYLDGSSADAVAEPEPAFVQAAPDPRYRDRFQPEYPYGAKRLGQEGTVVVEVRIGIDGRVTSASVAESSGFARLDEAATRHARRNWRFTPATSGGEPVESTARISLVFDLTDA